MITLLIVIQLVLAIVITIAVLLQKSSSIGLGAYSGSNESLFGAKGPAGFLTKFTFVVAIIFVLNTILLGYQYSKNLDKSLIDSVKTKDLPYESIVPTPPAPPISLVPDSASQSFANLPSAEENELELPSSNEEAPSLESKDLEENSAVEAPAELELPLQVETTTAVSGLPTQVELAPVETSSVSEEERAVESSAPDAQELQILESAREEAEELYKESQSSDLEANETKPAPALVQEDSLNKEGNINFDDLKEAPIEDKAPVEVKEESPALVQEDSLNKEGNINFDDLKEAPKEVQAPSSDLPAVEVEKVEVAPESIEERVAEINEESKILAEENAEKADEKVAEESKAIEEIQALEFGSYL